jgi:hypothetical protein
LRGQLYAFEFELQEDGDPISGSSASQFNSFVTPRRVDRLVLRVRFEGELPSSVFYRIRNSAHEVTSEHALKVDNYSREVKIDVKNYTPGSEHSIEWT